MNLAVRTILANQSFVAPCPPQPPSKSQDEGGEPAPRWLLLTFAHKRVHRLDRDQKVNKRVARSHRIEFGKLL